MAFDLAFWKSIIENDYAIPQGHTVRELTPPLIAMLGSPDPALRDEVASVIFARWIARDGHYSPDDLRDLMGTLTANLKTGDGEGGTLLRSFSALTLSVIAYHDVEASFLSEDEMRALLDSALHYLAAEQDVRGYVVGMGWLHAVAHTADLLKFLARNPKTNDADHLRILTTISDKLTAPLPYVYIHDEDERLTQAVTEVLKRGTLTHVALVGWIESFREWKQDHPKDAAFEPTIHAPYMNAKNFVRSLYLAVQMMALLDEGFKDLELEALKAVRTFGAGTIYSV